MYEELPEDIESARGLLKKAESHHERKRTFEDAIDNLNSHLIDNPDSP